MVSVIRASIMGQLPGGEVWSVNPVFLLLAGAMPGAPELLTKCNAINAITWPAGVTDMFSAGTSVTGVRLERRSLTGDLEAQAEAPRSSALAGTGPSTHPLQVSIVASLRTATPGGSGRGRLYFPATGTSLVSGTARIPTSNASGFIAGVKTLLSGISTAIGSNGNDNALVVWSRTTASTALVTGLRAGDVPDVQRRRRDSLTEVYSPVSYP